MHKVETYPDTCKDERHPEPDFAGDGQLPFRLQVIAEGDTEEHDTQCHEPRIKTSIAEMSPDNPRAIRQSVSTFSPAAFSSNKGMAERLPPRASRMKGQLCDWTELKQWFIACCSPILNKASVAAEQMASFSC